jgi:putative sigma-54 modulation protein
MQLNIRGKNVKVNEDRRQLIEKKLGTLDHYFDLAHDATVELSSEKSRNKDERLVIEMTVRANGSVLRAEERDSDLPTALERLHNKMQRQLTRYKERMVHRKGRTSTSEAVAMLNEPDTDIVEETYFDQEDTVPVRVKTFPVQPMLPEEAVEEMELVGHDFFVFQDAESKKFSVVYRRKDGAYGMLQPEVS